MKKILASYSTHLIRKAKALTTADANIQQIFTAPMPQPQAKPITLTPAQRTWAAPAKVKHINAAWATATVAAVFVGFILGDLAQLTEARE